MADPWDVFNAQAPAKKPPNKLEQFFSAVDKVENTPVYKAAQTFAQLPSEGVNALLGAPQRAIASRIGQVARNPRGVAETSLVGLLGPAILADPKAREQIGNELYATFHPNDPSIQANAQHAVGVDRLKKPGKNIPERLQNFGVDLGFQTLTDPLSFTGAGTAVSGEMALGKLGKLGDIALESPNEAVRGTASTFLTNVEERQGRFSKPDIAAVNSLRNRGITRSRAQQAADEALLATKPVAKALKKGEIAPELRQRLLEEPYVHGTPDMRAQALRSGFKPTPKQAAKPPTSTLDYDLRENYDPHTGMVKTPGNFETLLPGVTQKGKAPKAGMEMPQTGEALPGTLGERVRARLQQSRSVIQHRETQRALEMHLGVSPEMAGSLATEQKVGGLAPLRAWSQAKVDAMLAAGLPHIRNIGVMGYNAMGEGGMARASQFFFAGIPEKLTQRLEQGGGSAHFAVRTPGKFSPARLLPTPMRKLTTGAVDRADQATRAARLEQLDRSNPEMTEFQKMDRVNQDIGAYNQRPHYSKVLSGIGANFPQWHNYIVPTSVGRAVLRQPGRVERLARAVQTGNDDVSPNGQWRVTLGGPNDEAASAAADPARLIAGKGTTGRYPKYFGSASSLGPGVEFLHPSGGTIGQRALSEAASVVPFGSVILDEWKNPFHSPLAPGLRAAAGLTGVEMQKRTPASMERTRQALSPSAPGADPWAGIP